MTSTIVTRLRIETNNAPEFYDITEHVRWALADWKRGLASGEAAANFGPFDRADLAND